MIARLAAQLGDDEHAARALPAHASPTCRWWRPSNLTAWKEQLLRELYVRTLGALPPRARSRGRRSARGAWRSTAARAAELARRRRGASLDAWFAGLPDRYFAQAAPRDDRAPRAALARAARGPVAVEVTHRRRARLVGADRDRRRRARPAREDRRRAARRARRRPRRADRLAPPRRARSTRRSTSSSCATARAARSPRRGALARIAADLERVVGGAIAVEALVDPLVGERRARVAARARHARTWRRRSRSTTRCRPTSPSSTSTRRTAPACSTPSPAPSPPSASTSTSRRWPPRRTASPTSSTCAPATARKLAEPEVPALRAALTDALAALPL